MTKQLIKSFTLSLKIAAVSFMTVLLLNNLAFAAGDSIKIDKQSWTFNGIFGTFDRNALKRGYQIYSEVCASCHSLKYVAYRNLEEIGLNKEQIKEIAAEFEVEDGPDDDGEMFFRPARPSDRFVPPYPNEKASRASNNGAYPPDLSLMAKARKGGQDYIYALLTSYQDEAPDGVEIGDGMYYNTAYPGFQIAMAPPLENDTVEYEDGTTADLKQHARDISEFLMWTASPELEKRKSLGIKVILFLLVWTGMLIALKMKIWAKIH